jgi:glycosyltransferase involved in cell wall biosynthesis
MIVIYHQNNKVVSVEDGGENIIFSSRYATEVLLEISVAFPEELLIWCRSDLKSNLNFPASYNTLQNSFLSDAIGYVEESVFINISKKVTYPTWQMSSCVGGVRASVLLALKDSINVSDNLDYFLHSLAKLAMSEGLMCYSEPKLLKVAPTQTDAYQKNTFVLFRFVKQHYRTRWVFLLFLNLFLYERKFAFLPLISSLFYSKRRIENNLLRNIIVQSTKKVVESGTIDVIIPTIGRKKYLYDVLKDLSQQTHLPQNVIIVEQNPNQNSVSELDFLQNEIWNFKIKHIFTHQAGACNARNLALAEVESELVFMADDDIRIKNNFIKKALDNISTFNITAATFKCQREGEQPENKRAIQWSAFGSGCSIVKQKVIKNVKFDRRYEFGFGEDSDFGMQLRNEGIDIVYFPNPEIIHLKAPIGGFRTKPVLAWQNDTIQPKPSPTVMLYKLLHLSKEQICGYKTILFFKYYRVQPIKNPVKYFLVFQREWRKSLYWANKLKNQI